LVQATRDWLGAPGLEVFREYLQVYGRVDPVFKKEGSTIPHMVHLREGMQVRNFLRMRSECAGWGAHKLDDFWAEVVTRAIQ